MSGRLIGGVKKGGLALLVSVTSMAMSLYISQMVTRELGADFLGLTVFALTCATVISHISSFGATTSIVKLVGYDAVKRGGRGSRSIVSKAMLYTTSIGLLFSGVVFLVDGVFRIVPKNIDVEFFFPLLVVLIFQRSSSLLLGALRGVSKSVSSTTLDGAPVNFVMLIGITFMAEQNIIDRQNYIVVSAAACGFTVFLREYFWRRSTVHLTENPLSTFGIMRDSFPFLIGGLVFFSMRNIDTLMLGYLADSAELGYYSIAFRLAALLLVFQNVSNAFIHPRIVRSLASDNLDDAIKYCRLASTVLCVLGCIPLIVFIILGKQLLMLWGEGFEAYYGALVFLAIAQFVNVAVGPAGAMLMYSGFVRLRNRIAIFAFVLNVVLNYILILKWGGGGAAIATSLSIVFLHVGFWLGVKMKFNAYILPDFKVLMSLFNSRLKIE